MKCPSCGYKETKVIDSRINTDGNSIRRRRECLKCEKRPVSIDRIEEVTNEIERAIQKKYDREVGSSVIGEIIMEKLAHLDEVAYVRFASVYRQFRDVNQFMKELKVILEKDKEKELSAVKKK